MHCLCRLGQLRSVIRQGPNRAAGVHLQGKLDTESLLKDRDVNWTSVRPVYMCASSCVSDVYSITVLVYDSPM